MDLNKLEALKARLNQRLEGLDIKIRVDSNFLMLMILLLEELKNE
jgi:hypothetical protein